MLDLVGEIFASRFLNHPNGWYLMMRSAIGFLVDMDGVIYRGSELIPGAKDFIERLLEEHIPFLFLTNNSQRTRRDVERLREQHKQLQKELRQATANG